MGLCGSCAGGRAPVPSERMDRVIAMADLKRAHLNRFWKYYRQADTHFQGAITLAQYYSWLSEEQTKFADGVFELVDTPDMHVPGKKLNFDDFAAVLTTYCMFAEEEVLRYCFYLYDLDKHGYLEEEEVIDLVNTLHAGAGGAGGEAALNSNLMAILEQDVGGDDHRVTWPEFQAMNKKFPQLLFPAFRLQQAMMRVTFGEHFWAARRSAMESRRNEEAMQGETWRLRKERKVERARRRALRRHAGVVLGSLYLLVDVRERGAGAALPLVDNAALVECRLDEVVEALPTDLALLELEQAAKAAAAGGGGGGGGSGLAGKRRDEPERSGPSGLQLDLAAKAAESAGGAASLASIAASAVAGGDNARSSDSELERLEQQQRREKQQARAQRNARSKKRKHRREQVGGERRGRRPHRLPPLRAPDSGSGGGGGGRSRVAPEEDLVMV